MNNLIGLQDVRNVRCRPWIMKYISMSNMHECMKRVNCKWRRCKRRIKQVNETAYLCYLSCPHWMWLSLPLQCLYCQHCLLLDHAGSTLWCQWRQGPVDEQAHNSLCLLWQVEGSPGEDRSISSLCLSLFLSLLCLCSFLSFYSASFGLCFFSLSCLTLIISCSNTQK